MPLTQFSSFQFVFGSLSVQKESIIAEFPTTVWNPVYQSKQSSWATKNSSKWWLRNLFGQKIFTNQLLLPEFAYAETQANPCTGKQIKLR